MSGPADAAVLSKGGKALPFSHRPRQGSEMRQRGKQISIRLTETEYAQIDAAADRDGLTVASYLRSRALLAPQTRAQRRPAVERHQLAAILAQLGKIGSNLNQIARTLNRGGDLPGELAAALAEWRDAGEVIWRLGGNRPRRARLGEES